MLCIKMLQGSSGIHLPFTSLCAQPRSYNITIRDGVTYRKTQAHLKPYQPQCKKTEDEHSGSDMQTLKANCKQCDNIKCKNNHAQSPSRPKRDIKPPIFYLICFVMY